MKNARLKPFLFFLLSVLALSANAQRARSGTLGKNDLIVTNELDQVAGAALTLHANSEALHLNADRRAKIDTSINAQTATNAAIAITAPVAVNLGNHTNDTALHLAPGERTRILVSMDGASVTSVVTLAVAAEAQARSTNVHDSVTNAFAIANLANTRAQAANVTNAQNGAAIASVSNLTVTAQNTANAVASGVTAVSNLVIGVKALNESAITNETDRIALQALSTNRVTAIFNPTNANEWTDGNGDIWAITSTAWYVSIEDGFSGMTNGYYRVDAAPESISEWKTSYSVDDVNGISVGLVSSPTWYPKFCFVISGKEETSWSDMYLTGSVPDSVYFENGNRIDRITATGIVTRLVTQKYLSENPMYPTNYIAGFVLPIPGTNTVYTLNVNSNGILEVWGVMP